MLTPEGMAAQIEAEFGLSMDDFSCEPLLSLEISSPTTCSGSYVGTIIDMDVQVVAGSATTEPYLVVATRTELPQ